MTAASYQLSFVFIVWSVDESEKKIKKPENVIFHRYFQKYS